MRHTLSLLLAGLLSSCAASTGIIRPGFRPEAIIELTYASPVARIATIEHGNQPAPSQEASAESARLMRQLLAEHHAELRLQNELVIPDSLQQSAKREIYWAVEGINKRQRLDTSAHLPVLDALLTSQHQRYLLVTATQGFTRTALNYSQQMAKTIGVGLLTLGTMVPIALKSRSDVCLFIYDRQQQLIVYYNHTPDKAEHEPLDKAGLEFQLRTMLKRDFPLR